MQQIMTADDVARTLARMADEIRATASDLGELVVVGIHTRGYYLGLRLATMLGVPSGSLDIALYRDDLSLQGVRPVLKHTDIPCSIDDRRLILVDDVLFTGRTIRAALDALADLGRTRSIRLATLIDRGHRELPIQPDICGMKLKTQRQQRVFVRLVEHDGEDGVYLSDNSQEER